MHPFGMPKQEGQKRDPWNKVIASRYRRGT